MKVLLHINSLAVGGAEVTVVKLAGHWVKQGHEVVILTQTTVESDRLQVPEGVLRLTTDTAGVSQSLFDGLSRNLRRLRRLRRMMRTLKPGMVIGFLPTANVQLLLAGIGLGIRTFVAERAYPEHLQLLPLQTIVRDVMYPRAAGVVVQTREGESWYQKRLSLRNTVVIPNGIALPIPQRLPPAPEDKVVPPDAKIILFIGRMAEPKCPEVAVEAFSDALADREEWHFVLIGSGDKQQLVSDAAGQGKLRRRVHVLPEAGNTAEWYERASIFVSVSRFEGFPNVLLEAMAHGVACVAWNCHPGPSEMIDDGVNGCLVPVNDVQAMSRTLRGLVEDQD